jgi:hypothetical protein
VLNATFVMADGSSAAGCQGTAPAAGCWLHVWYLSDAPQGRTPVGCLAYQVTSATTLRSTQTTFSQQCPRPNAVIPAASNAEFTTTLWNSTFSNTVPCAGQSGAAGGAAGAAAVAVAVLASVAAARAWNA